MLTDSHCHLASHRFEADEVPRIIASARDAGVTRLVTLATSLEDIEANLAIAEAHPEVRCCVGIHPCDVHLAPDDAVERFTHLLSDPRVAAVGETGLDHFHPAPEGWDEEQLHERQAGFLEAHFQAAADAGLNVVIHTRDRSGDTSLRSAIDIYRRFADRVRAVFHCFIGSRSNAEEVIGLGGLVSFGGVATFRNATEVLELAATLPLESLMLETDSPYLAPHPFRGRRNEPSNVRTIAERIAEARGIRLEELACATTRTASAFFRGFE